MFFILAKTINEFDGLTYFYSTVNLNVKKILGDLKVSLDDQVVL